MNHCERPAPARFRVLLVDDDPAYIEDISSFLTNHFETGVARDGSEAIARVEDLRPDVVLLDIEMGSGPNGFDVLEKIRALEQPPPVVMVTGDDDVATAVRAIRSGAYHYVTKKAPLSELVNLTNLAAASHATKCRIAALEGDVHRLGGRFVVSDPAMQRVVRQIERVGPTDTTVLIAGETGTGKELVARNLHQLSPRSKGPFVAINCRAIPESTIESALFGHVKGAFTGADREHDGVFMQAHQGTLFLDEIAHATTDLQLKLLRVIEERELSKVGGSRSESFDVRFVAASSRDLEDLVASGQFNDELYYRLNVYRIDLPPLRARPHDIMPLAEYFLGVFSGDAGRPGMQFGDSAIRFLKNNEWRGNVRSLKNAIERAVIDSGEQIISAVVFEQISPESPTILPGLREAEKSFRYKYLREQLRRSEGKVSEAARLSGVSRSTFYTMMNELELGESLDKK